MLTWLPKLASNLSKLSRWNIKVEHLPQWIYTYSIFTLDIASIPSTLSLAIIQRQRRYRSPGSGEREKLKKVALVVKTKSINSFLSRWGGFVRADQACASKSYCYTSQDFVLFYIVFLCVSVIIKELWENLPLNEGYKIAGTFTNPGLNVSKVWLNSCGDLLVSLLVLQRCLKVQSITPTVKPWWRNSYSLLTGSYRWILRSGSDAWGVDSGPYVSVDGIRGEGRDLYWTLGPIRRQSLWLIKGLKRAGWWARYWLPGENERTLIPLLSQEPSAPKSCLHQMCGRFCVFVLVLSNVV